MIRRIYSDLPKFKELQFHAGLNIILAEKTPGAKDKQTSNSSGKSSIIEIIHFLTGAKKDEKKLVFQNVALKEQHFGMNFDLGAKKITVERSAKDEEINNIFIKSDDYSDWPISPNKKKDTQQVFISIPNWWNVLGYFMFRLGVDAEQKVSYGPKFRSLFSYFVRRELVGAFHDPIKQSSMQQPWDQQVAISFLIGLDWTISQQWQQLRKQESALKLLRTALRKGALRSLIETTAELRSKITVSKRAVERLRETVDSFRVLPEYESFEKEAAQLTAQLADLTNENFLDQRLIRELEESRQTEKPPTYSDIENLYEEAGLILPEVVKRRFDEVSAFHESVIENRRGYLEAEIVSSTQRIKDRQRLMNTFDERRAEIMGILDSHGALDQYRKLQSELNKKESELEALQRSFETAERIESTKTELEIDQRRLLLRLQQDLKEQSDNLEEAILAFEETSSSLYEKPGVFTVTPSTHGPVFDIKLSGDKGAAIRKMAIYCFDMMLMRICTKRQLGPGFLVHDSHLFEGVDPRQVSAAIVQGATAAEKLGFQYIVTLNQFELPDKFPSDFKVEDYILPVRLTDKTEDGGLFGFRFE
jgi:uncharacterized protein YydD (DUF2326 family)